MQVMVTVTCLRASGFWKKEVRTTLISVAQSCQPQKTASGIGGRTRIFSTRDGSRMGVRFLNLIHTSSGALEGRDRYLLVTLLLKTKLILFLVSYLQLKFLRRQTQIRMIKSNHGFFRNTISPSPCSGAHTRHMGRETSGADYVVISSGQWWFKKNFLCENNKHIGDYSCEGENVTDLGLSFAYCNAFRTTLKFINNCKECGYLLMIVSTFSPAHFENGTWDNGGESPLDEKHVALYRQTFEIRNRQARELRRVKEEGKKLGKRFMLLDVSRATVYKEIGIPELT
ncbi:hypothetical protein Ancab_039028 [Ancistrocladus abbreviatus]